MPPWSHDLIVIAGNEPVQRAIAAIAATTAEWIVIYFPDRVYAFQTSELRGHPKLKRYRDAKGKRHTVTLGQALQLHEPQRSTRTRGRTQLPAYEGEPGARETVERFVLVNDQNEPVAVLPAPAKANGGERRERSARRATRHSARAKPPAMEAAAPAAEDEGTSPVRFPSIDSATALRAGKPVTLKVDLLRTESTDTMGGQLAIGELPQDWRELKIMVQLVSNQITFEKNGKGTVTIRRNADSEPATIKGTVSAQLGAGNPITVNAVFSYNQRFCGGAVRVFGEGAARAEAQTPSTDAQDASVIVEHNAEPPDLTVQILVPDPSAPGKLLWLMQPSVLFDELPASLEGRTNVGLSGQVYASKLFAEFAQLDRGKHMRRMQGFGDRLWKQAPPEFRDTYWAMWDRYKQPFTIQFVSSEAHIPWELMRPSRDGEAQALLAVQHPVARWIGSHRSLMRQQLPAGSLFSIVPRYKNAAARLKRAEAESALLQNEFDAHPVTATYADVLRFLESPPPHVAFLHFAGHGTFDASSVDSSTIKLEDGALTVDEVAREEVKLGAACRTVVFLNACEVGATGSALGTVGGWADAFIGRKFGGFIAPLWAVDDEDAGKVSQTLLTGVLKTGQPIGAVLRSIREDFGAESPTFLSYLFYGDVNARINPGK